MKNFEIAFKHTVGLEGGFGLDPNDSGNWTGGKIGVGELKGTKYGISAATYPNENIAALTIEKAKEIYYRDFWICMDLDKIISEQISGEMFDTGVNMGCQTSIKIAQKALQFIGESIEVDGLIGPNTISAINRWICTDEEALFKALNGFQFMKYVDIVNASSTHRFARGWMKRIGDYRR